MTPQVRFLLVCCGYAAAISAALAWDWMLLLPLVLALHTAQPRYVWPAGR